VNHVFYHSADLDGHCGGAVVRYHLEKLGEPYAMHPIDYGDDFRAHFLDITPKDNVFLVDWSPEPEDFEALLRLLVDSTKVIWLDHHERRITEVLDHLMGTDLNADMPGNATSFDDGLSGC